MKRVYKLEGLDCADCAAKLEKKLAAIDGITSANINFMTRNLINAGVFIR